MKITLLISTYNRPDALDVVLDSVSRQTRMPDEIVVCDDGSGPETADVVKRWQQRLRVPVIHVWHEDRGFRLAAIRNKGIAASTGEYIIQIDGDVMLERHFVADHADSARSGYYIKGSRVRLSPYGSAKICAARIACSISPISRSVMRDRMKNFRFATLGRLFGTRYHRDGVAIGCNMSFWRSDFMRVNGYDEHYEGWGVEDTDLCMRLEGIGIHTFKLFRMGLCWHLWHNERPTPHLREAYGYMMDNIDNKKYVAERGMTAISKMATEVRIDKWLWAMRIFKTRTIATEACKKGRITLNADPNPVKPARTVKPGDEVHVRKPPVTYTFRVKAVTENRLGAKLVPEYLENITPQDQYDLLDVVKISGFVDRRKGLGRPTKREGRELARFTDSYASNEGWDFDFDDID